MTKNVDVNPFQQEGATGPVFRVRHPHVDRHMRQCKNRRYSVSWPTQSPCPSASVFAAFVESMTDPWRLSTRKIGCAS
eukprot:14437694-Alexandrium_andersonii.AAC.1